MGFSFGKSSSKGVSGQSATQRHASNILLEAILPGSSMTGGYISDQTPSGTIPTSRAAGGSNQDTGMGMRIGAPNLGPRPHMPGGDYSNEPLGPLRKMGDAPGSSVRGTFGVSDDIAQSTVSRKMGNYVPSARQQGFGALAGHGMTEAYRQQAGPYTSVQGNGMVASYDPLSQQETDDVTRTLLPSLEDMRYRGTFERLQDGDLSEGAASIINQGVEMASDPGAAALEMGKNIDDAVLNGQVLELPELPAISEFINKEYENLAPPIKSVIDDLMSGATESNLQSSLDTNVQALTNQANEALTGMLDDTYGRFSASGVSGGAMLAASGDVTTKVMADLSGQIAAQYQQTAAQMAQDRQIGLQAVQTLIGLGQQEQAMEQQRQVQQLETTLNLVQAKYQMYTGLTQQFVQANLQYANIIAQEVDRENTEQINSMRMFYEILVSLATGGPALSNQRSQSSNFGVDLSALAPGKPIPPK